MRVTNTTVAHNGISCDECGMNPILGIRYQCAEGCNYDQCDSCNQTKGITHGHSFIQLFYPKAVLLVQHLEELESHLTNRSETPPEQLLRLAKH